MFNSLINSFVSGLHQTAVRPFVNRYSCLPVAAANKSSLEAGDKIILPTSALTHLAQLQVQYPMQFNIKNLKTGKSTHCGVMEFSAEEGRVYIPYWMMQELLLEYNDMVEIRNVSLEKGSFVKLQPHSVLFTQLHNPRAVLERALRNFSCLTKGDTISIQHGEQTFLLNIVEVKPGNAISIIETDVNVDFDAPLDYKEPIQRPNVSAAESLSHQSNAIVAGDFTFHGHAADEQKNMFDQQQHLKTDVSQTTQTTTMKCSSSDYFAKLGPGRTVSGKCRATSKTNTPQSSQPLQTNSSSNFSLATPPQTPTTFTSTTSSTSTQSCQVTEVKGQWAYIYSMDAQGNKKLVKRVAASSLPKQSGMQSKGYSLK